jgi:outer membrane protein OmpA-like peptidoglycan-associated protein
MKLVLRSCAVLALCCWAFSMGFAQSKTDDNKALLPSSPAAAPDPAPAKKVKDPHVKPGSDFPHEELFLGYSYFHFAPGAGLPQADFNGGSASFAYNFNRYVGLAGDFGGYHAGDYAGKSLDANIFSYLFGPRFSYRNNTRWTPFAQILLGGAHGSYSNLSSSTSGSSNGFAMAAGGGVDVGLNRRFAIRLFQVEYFLTDFNPNVSGIPTHQNDIRASSGLVIRWGYKPVAINQPPTAACSVNPTSVTIGSDTLVTFSVNASDPDGDSLTYSYTTTGGNISGDGPNARWDLAGQNPGNYNATAQVNDGHGGTASCSASVTVNPRPNRPPTVSLSSDRDTVLVGECVNFTAVGLDPNGYSLTYTWVSNGGQITPSNTTARLCTTGVAPGSYTTTVRVDNGHDGAADASKAITVQAPPPPPQASKIGECAFGKPLSTRIDNVCKRILDDVALRLQNEPRASAVIIGYSDPKERRPGKIAGDRGTNAVKYLGEKGIDASRITTRTGAGQAGATNNRRIDVIYVPEGATY